MTKKQATIFIVVILLALIGSGSFLAKEILSNKNQSASVNLVESETEQNIDNKSVLPVGKPNTFIYATTNPTKPGQSLLFQTDLVNSPKKLGAITLNIPFSPFKSQYALTSSGELFYILDKDNKQTLVKRDLKTEKEETLPVPLKKVFQIEVTEDGKWIVLSDQEGLIAVNAISYANFRLPYEKIRKTDSESFYTDIGHICENSHTVAILESKSDPDEILPVSTSVILYDLETKKETDRFLFSRYHSGARNYGESQNKNLRISYDCNQYIEYMEPEKEDLNATVPYTIVDRETGSRLVIYKRLLKDSYINFNDPLFTKDGKKVFYYGSEIGNGKNSNFIKIVDSTTGLEQDIIEDVWPIGKELEVVMPVMDPQQTYLFSDGSKIIHNSPSEDLSRYTLLAFDVVTKKNTVIQQNIFPVADLTPAECFGLLMGGGPGYEENLEECTNILNEINKTDEAYSACYQKVAQENQGKSQIEISEIAEEVCTEEIEDNKNLNFLEESTYFIGETFLEGFASTQGASN